MDFEVGNEQLTISSPLKKYLKKVERNWSVHRFWTDMQEALIGLGGMFCICIMPSLSLAYTLESSWVINV